VYDSGGGYYRSYDMMPYTESMPPTDQRRERINPDDRRNRNNAPDDTDNDRVSQPAPARIVVQLPADAKLTIDGAPTTSTSANRVFTSPLLEAGRDFYYTFRATMVQDGQPVTTEQRVLVRAGKESRVKMDFTPTSLRRE
jgi:uncharacterized protein (TIGR03000 family)